MVAEYIRDLFPEQMKQYVYIGELPTDIDNCIAIAEMGGPHGNYFNKDHLDTPYVKLIIRHASYPTGAEFAEFCKATLASYAETLPFGLVLINDIMYFGRDDERRNMWQLTFKVFSYYSNK